MKKIITLIIPKRNKPKDRYEAEIVLRAVFSGKYNTRNIAIRDKQREVSL